VFVNGCDEVRLLTVGGEMIFAEPIAGSDTELIGMIQTLARRGGHIERVSAWSTSRSYNPIRSRSDSIRLV
jgi:hypothetical protein